METIVKGVTRILGWVLMILMTLIVLDVTWQVFTRFMMQNSSSWTEEMARFLLIWIGLLGASYTLHTRMHLGIDIFTYKLTGKKKQVIEILIYLFVLLFALIVMVIGGFKLMSMTFQLNQTSAAMGIKMAYIYFVIPLSGILMIFYSIDFMVKALTTKEK
ncbi:MAG: TRAP transporter small permease [Candidatus Marinimicrobia bacterium]|nr:TRAP transporter small permease [Candidatus Neomarinimicrobiota bacterium]